MSIQKRIVPFLLALGLAACGGHQNTALPGMPLMTFNSANTTIPSDPAEWTEFLGGSATLTAEEALLQSYVFETSGDLVETAAVLMTDLSWPASLDVIRWLRIYNLRNRIPEFNTMVSVWLSDQPSSTSELTRFIQNELHFVLEYRNYRYSMEEGMFDYEQFGTPSTWNQLGPLSLNTALDVENPTIAADLLSISEGVSFDDRPLEATLTYGGLNSVEVNGQSGIFLMESFLETEQAGDFLIAFDSGNSYVAMIDGVEVLHRSVDELWTPTLQFGRVHLEAGTHQVRIRTGASGGKIWLRMIPLDGAEITAFNATIPPAIATGTTSSDPIGQELGELLSSSENSGLSWLISAEIAEISGSVLDAERLIETADRPTDPVFALRIARLTDHLDQHDPSRAQNIALSVLREAADRWENDTQLDIEFARRLREAGQLDAAYFRIESALRQQPDNFEVQVELANIYREEGWSDLSQNALRRAVTIFPLHCNTVSSVLNTMVARNEAISPETIPQEWLSCDATLRALLTHHYRPLGELQTSFEIASLLSSRNPTSSSAYETMLDAAIALENEELVVELIENGATQLGGDHNASLYLRDLDFRAGDNEAVELSLAEELLETPTEINNQTLASFFAATPLWEDLRYVGLEAIAEYESSGVEYNDQAVYVLDYASTRYFEDGSGVQITHQILQPLTRETIAAFGEVGIPRNARLLTVRTIKADGRILYPTDIGDRNAISMPDLEVGDYIELEYLSTISRSQPSWLRANTYQFFFQVSDGTLHNSIMRYDYPISWENEVIFDVRNMNTSPIISQNEEFITRVYQVTSSPPTPTDTGAPMNAEWLPNVRMAYGITWEETIEMYQDLVMSVTVPTPNMVETARSLVADIPDRSARIQRIFRFVNDEFLDAGGFFSSSVTYGWLSYEADRLALVYTLLEAIGETPELVFIRSLAADHTPLLFADTMVFDAAALRVPLNEENALWLEPQTDFFPFNYISSDAQNCEAIVITGNHAGDRIQTPDWPLDFQKNHVSISLTIEADGSATGIIEENLSPENSTYFRSWLDYLQDDRELTQTLESSISRSFTGASIQTVDISNQHNVDEPISVRYTFSVPQMVSVEEDRLFFDTSIFSNASLATLVRWPNRSRVLVVETSHIRDVSIEVQVPENMQMEVLSQNIELESGQNSFSLTFETEGNTLLIRRETVIMNQRIQPENYPSFASFITGIINADQLQWNIVENN